MCSGSLVWEHFQSLLKWRIDLKTKMKCLKIKLSLDLKMFFKKIFLSCMLWRILICMKDHTILYCLGCSCVLLHSLILGDVANFILDFLEFSFFFSHFVTCLLQLHILVDLFGSLPYFAISFHLSHMTMPRDVFSFIKIKDFKRIIWIEIILV